MERYRIKLPTDQAFDQALAIVQGQVPLFVTSAKRRILSTGELPADLRWRIDALGGEVTAEVRYEIERVPAGPA
jgi:hypothetical protein